MMRYRLTVAKSTLTVYTLAAAYCGNHQHIVHHPTAIFSTFHDEVMELPFSFPRRCKPVYSMPNMHTYVYGHVCCTNHMHHQVALVTHQLLSCCTTETPISFQMMPHLPIVYLAIEEVFKSQATNKYKLLCH